MRHETSWKTHAAVGRPPAWSTREANGSAHLQSQHEIDMRHMSTPNRDAVMSRAITPIRLASSVTTPGRMLGIA